jgi:hypothetical protein
MAIVVVCPLGVHTTPGSGGHAWVFLQYVLCLRDLGCEVYWLERTRSTPDPAEDQRRAATFAHIMDSYGLQGRTMLYRASETGGKPEFLNIPASEAESILKRSDLLLNFEYEIDEYLVGIAQRAALVDIDPGLFQTWLSLGQLQVPNHDIYFTVGETVGTTSAAFPDCGIRWNRIHPPVHLRSWRYAFDAHSEAFTTVSGWWGEWLQESEHLSYENSKRVSFLQFVDLPAEVPQRLELALSLPEDPSDVMEIRSALEPKGWRVRSALERGGSASLNTIRFEISGSAAVNC